jgi:hypothetical protein
MANLTRAHEELFRRTPDECFESLEALREHCRGQKRESLDRWQAPSSVAVLANGTLRLHVGNDGPFALNDWSFSQVCKMARVAKETVNRLSPHTAAHVFAETMPGGTKPLQVLTAGQSVRSVHGTQYTRLWNADLVSMLLEFAVDFQPPQKAFNGATGLYAGEQDLFCFLIDPAGWTEIQGEAFAPGFFVWNSEVGRRSLGIQTFWFQAVCQNHLVWDACEIVDWTRKHTANVHEGLAEIRHIVEGLVARRDARKDGFAAVIRKAMETRLGSSAGEVEATLAKSGIARQLAKRATEIAREQGRFTIFSVVDALTRIARECRNAGDRTEADEKAGGLLALAAA